MKKENNSYLYIHRRLDTNEVFYVGISSDKNFKRAYAKNKTRANDHWHKIVKKAGYAVDIIYKNISWEQACKYEINLIAMYGRKDLGLGKLTNHTNGGEGKKGNIVDESTKEKLRKINLGKKLSQETKNKISLGGKGRKLSEEALKRKKEWYKNNPSITKKFEESSKKRLGLPNKLSKIYINLETGVFHYSLSEAARAYNIKVVTLQKRVYAGIGKIVPI